MGKFKDSGSKSVPAVSTASLPDIIFMLLFFFMVTTVMRDSELKLDVHVPKASELTKIKEKSLVNYIFIGKPKDKKLGTAPTIQLNDKISKPTEIPLFLEKHKLKVPENKRLKITSSIKGDKGVTMGIVQDVKVQLRKYGQYKVLYSARSNVNNTSK